MLTLGQVHGLMTRDHNNLISKMPDHVDNVGGWREGGTREVHV